MREERVLRRVEFDTKLPHYWMLLVCITLAMSIIGIPLIPLWLIFGRAFHQRQFECLECELTERSLNIRRGVIFKVEKNIPLDKLQDMGLREGPLLRRLGLSSLVVETAGQSSPQGSSDATLTGVVDCPAFRDAVLNQRDLVAGGPGLGSHAPVREGEQHTLVEIRDSLKRIEGLLERQLPDS